MLNYEQPSKLQICCDFGCQSKACRRFTNETGEAKCDEDFQFRLAYKQQLFWHAYNRHNHSQTTTSQMRRTKFIQNSGDFRELTVISMDNNEEVSEKVIVNPIVYFQKPIIGNTGGVDVPPLQLVFQKGGFGLGVAVKEQIDNEEGATGNFPVIASGPEFSLLDKMEKYGIKLAFIVLAIINLVVTSMMFFRADTLDPSKVEYSTGSLPGVFEIVSSERRGVELGNYAFVVITLFIGSVSVLFDIPLGVSAYALSVMLNFILGTSALPLFIYCTRYVFDAFMLYFALVYRSKLVYIFLPAHVASRAAQ